MSTAEAKPNKWRKRLWRLALTSTLLGTFFAVGVMFTAYVAVRWNRFGERPSYNKRLVLW
jgi:Mg/Co/Ni transporter MgtE